MRSTLLPPAGNQKPNWCRCMSVSTRVSFRTSAAWLPRLEQALPIPGRPKLRQGPGSHSVGDAAEIKSQGARAEPVSTYAACFASCARRSR
jgi:hypothetical protein